MQLRKIGIIGIGNPLRRDDGIGIILINCLKGQKKELPNCLELVDAGALGMNLLHIFARFDVILLIDAIDFKGAIGESRILTLDDIRRKHIQFRTSTHETDFLQIVQLSKELNELPDKLLIFGIQPKDTSYGMGLTQEMEAVVNVLVLKIKHQIELLLKQNIG